MARGSSGIVNMCWVQSSRNTPSWFADVNICNVRLCKRQVKINKHLTKRGVLGIREQFSKCAEKRSLHLICFVLFFCFFYQTAACICRTCTISAEEKLSLSDRLPWLQTWHFCFFCCFQVCVQHRNPWQCEQTQCVWWLCLHTDNSSVFALL